MEFKEYDITITETWQKVIRVLAVSPEEAKSFVKQQFDKGEICCEKGDFVGVDLEASRGQPLSSDCLKALSLGLVWLVPACAKEDCV